MAYSIEFSPEACDHMRTLSARQRGLVVGAMKRQLPHEPVVETRQRKPMKADRPGYIAPWELRVGDLRVYYEVLEDKGQVRIVAIGIKDRNRVLIGGKEVKVES